MTTKITFNLPIKTVSELNQREHWSKRHTRLSQHRDIAFFIVRDFIVREKIFEVSPIDGITEKIKFILTRNGKKKLDMDNLASSFKGVIDGIADAIRIDDGRVLMEFSQTIGNKEYSVDVTIEVIK